MPLFTINLDVRNWPCLVIGGGTIAIPKARRLLEAGAHLTMVSPYFNEELPGAILLHRPAQLSDLDGKRLAIFGTDDKQVNRDLHAEAQRRGILSMAVDDPEAADFFSPAIHRQGDLEFAVSTGGKGPAFSARVKRLLAEIFDEAHGQALDWYGNFRKTALEGRPTKDRISISRKVLDGDYAAWFREGRVAELDEKARHILKEWDTQ